MGLRSGDIEVPRAAERRPCEAALNRYVRPGREGGVVAANGGKGPLVVASSIVGPSPLSRPWQSTNVFGDLKGETAHSNDSRVPDRAARQPALDEKASRSRGFGCSASVTPIHSSWSSSSRVACSRGKVADQLARRLVRRLARARRCSGELQRWHAGRHWCPPGVLGGSLQIRLWKCGRALRSRAEGSLPHCRGEGRGGGVMRQEVDDKARSEGLSTGAAGVASEPPNPFMAD